MASKPPPHNPAPVFAVPPLLAAADSLLAASLSLPLDPCISYVVFAPAHTPASSLPPHDALELARREILNRNAATPLIDSLLTSIHIGINSFIYVFRVTSQDQASTAADMLRELQFDGLTAVQSAAFTHKDIYACSQTCALQSKPCSGCANTEPERTSWFPRKPLRNAYSHFLDAVRIRLLDDIALAACKKTRYARRLNGGFLLGPPQSTNEWAFGWEHQARFRPLVHCQLQLNVSSPINKAPSLIIHPLVYSTPFIPLSVALPLPAGTPVTLLPHATPAYYLNQYTGPTSALIKQFQDSLQGLGVSGWEDVPESSYSPFSGSYSSKPPLRNSMFIIAWIKVENKQGEDKGLVIIYPTSLCLSFTPSPTAFPSHQPLDYLPDLPTPLQPSPQVQPALPVTSAAFVPPNGTPPLHFEPSSHPAPSQSSTSAPNDLPLRRPIYPPSPTTDSLRAFRALTLSKFKDINRVAAEVGEYVDTVFKERERERERLRREQKNVAAGGPGTSPRITRASTHTPGSTSIPTPATAETPTASTSAPTTGAQVHPLSTQASAIAPAPMPQATANQIQNFYPSPPQTNPPIVPTLDGVQTSPVVESLSERLPSEPSVIQTQAAPTPADSKPAAVVPPDSSSSVYDPYRNIDSTWSSAMGMDMDFGLDMGFNMNMDGNRAGGSRYDARDSGIDFDDAFTDDDFSFFDRPSHGSVTAASTNAPVSDVRRVSGSITTVPHARPSGFAAASPSLYGDVSLSGPGPPQQTATPQHQPSPWTAVGDAFTPRFVTDDHGMSARSLVPDLFPPSPGRTSDSHTTPTTPAVHLDVHALGLGAIATPGRSSAASSRKSSTGFEPIPFAPWHREVDTKYSSGKFAFCLPSPPADDDDDDGVGGKDALLDVTANFVEMFPKSAARDGWGAMYMAATDPRVGVVRKLIGVKRKLELGRGKSRKAPRLAEPTPLNAAERRRVWTMKTSPAWTIEHDDWDRTVRQPDEDEDVSALSDAESDTDSSIASDSPVISRPSTPPPAYLPLGPSLLATHFAHSHLLPLSRPLRRPGAVVAPSGLAAAATPVPSVPTPVSPAAMVGASSEKSRSLEAAAFTVAVEAVENALWARAWRSVNSCSASVGVSSNGIVGGNQATEGVRTEVKAIAQLLKDVPGLKCPLDLGTVFNLDTTAVTTPMSTAKPLQLMEAPKIIVGKGNALLQMLPTALRFWEKLGLGPRGGRKDGTVFVLFEGDGEQKQTQVEEWIKVVAATYESKHLGKLSLGSSSASPKHGLVPLRLDTSFRKSLASFIANLPALQTSLIFFVIIPMATMSLGSTVLRQVFCAVKKALKTYSEAQILFQFIPENLIMQPTEMSISSIQDLNILCSSIYNRILVPVDRVMSRRIHEHGERIRNYFHEPAFTLARPPRTKVSFTRDSHAPLDVVDRYTLMHVGYQVSPCGKWILAACIDERGEAHDVGVWLTQSTPRADDGESSPSPSEASGGAEDSEKFLVRKVWEFAVEFARKANIEWRMVITKLGVMGEHEFLTWIRFLEVELPMCTVLPMVHVSLVSVEVNAPWSFISNPAKAPVQKPKSAISRSSSSSSLKNSHSHMVFTDVSSTVYAVFPESPLPQSFPPEPTDLGLSASYIPESEVPAIASSSASDDKETQLYFLPHPILPVPCSTTTLIRLPVSSSPTAISMMHIHLLHVFPAAPLVPSSSARPGFGSAEDVKRLHADITKNYHDLAVLAQLRWKLDVHPLLPFHLGAVEAMRVALDRDRHRGSSEATDT